MSRGPMVWPDMACEAIGMSASAILCARLLQAECTSTAFVTLNAQPHDSFDLSEVTRAGHAAPREIMGMLDVRVPM